MACRTDMRVGFCSNSCCNLAGSFSSSCKISPRVLTKFWQFLLLGLFISLKHSPNKVNNLMQALHRQQALPEEGLLGKLRLKQEGEAYTKENQSFKGFCPPDLPGVLQHSIATRAFCVECFWPLLALGTAEHTGGLGDMTQGMFPTAIAAGLLTRLATLDSEGEEAMGEGLLKWL